RSIRAGMRQQGRSLRTSAWTAMLRPSAADRSRSYGRPPSVHADRLTGHVATCAVHEIEQRGVQFLGFAGTTGDRSAVQETLHPAAVDDPAGEFAAEHADRDRVD